MNNSSIDVVGLCGSLRAASINRMALGLAGQVMPAGMELEQLEWEGVPPFSADHLAGATPPSVITLSEHIRRADAVVIVTPEYNFSIPGMFKNMLDWLSRVDAQPFACKPVAMMSASTGPLGGARVQYELRRVFQFLNANVLNKPEVFIGNASGKFSPGGECIDEATIKFVAAQMLALQDLLRRNSADSHSADRLRQRTM